MSEPERHSVLRKKGLLTSPVPQNASWEAEDMEVADDGRDQG